MAREKLAGEIVIEVRFGLPPLTVTVAEPLKVPDCAATVATPDATPVTTPAALTVATFKSEELHFASEVKSFVDPSEYDPVACKESVAAAASDRVFGLTEMPLRRAGTGCPLEPGWPPELGCPLEPCLALLGLLLTPLQAARNRQNERIQILRCTLFLRGVALRVNRTLLFEADMNQRFEPIRSGGLRFI